MSFETMASDLKIIIAGGGIAGLTLANALEVSLSQATVNSLDDISHSKQTSTMSYSSEEKK